MDYTFSTVNQHSVDIAPTHSMQFGHALQRLLQRLAYCNPAWGPPLMAKLDLSDGYYRVPLAAEASLELAVILPLEHGTEPLLAIPLSLPMGWSLSPPWFCAFTETCADLFNHSPQPTTFDHPYQDIVQLSLAHPTAPTFAPETIFPQTPTLPHQPLSYTDVYLDDFMLLAQSPTHLQAINILLHHVHSIFRNPPHLDRRQIVSHSKVLKGDATLQTKKRLLGWDIDSENLTIQFSLLQHLLKGNRRRMRIPRLAKIALHDWQHMLSTLAKHPMPITAIVPHAPHYYGATDASADGMGGWWVPTTLSTDSQPTIWRQPFPDNVRQALATSENQGTLNISELELAAAVLGHDLLLNTTPWHLYRSIMQGTDNSATQAWITHGATSASFIPAHFLRLLARASRRHNSTLSSVFIPGHTNTLSDLLSRSFHLTDDALLAAVHTLAPLQQPWRLVTPTEAEAYMVNSLLLKTRRDEEYRFLEQSAMIPHGVPGRSSASPYPKTLGSAHSKTPCPYFKYLPTDTASAKWLPPALQSRLERWRRPFVPWVRRLPHWDNVTQDSKHQADWTSDSTGNSKLTQKQIPRLHE